MSYTPRTSQPSRSSKYYSSGNPFTGRYSMWNGGNCTAYAWGRFHEILESTSDTKGCHLGTGNAEDWWNQTYGYKKGQTPALGAVLCLKNGPYSGYGHVAVVEKISSDGKKIWTSESGYKAYTFKYRERTAPNWNSEGYGFQGFIYNPSGGKAGSTTLTTSTKKKVKANIAFVTVAKNELKAGVKETGVNSVKYNDWYYGKHVSGSDYPWCAVFVCWCAYKALGKNWKNTFGTKNLANAALQDNLKGKWIKHGGAVRKHIGIIAEVHGTTAKTVEGNHGDKVGSRTVTVPSDTQPGDIITFNGSTVVSIKRPKWPDGLFEVDADGSIISDEEEVISGSISFNKTTEQLYSSENYKYVSSEDKENNSQQQLADQRKTIRDILDNIKVNNPSKELIVPDISLKNIKSISIDGKNKKTKVKGNISGSNLPSALSYVEAPYISINLGGIDIGTYHSGHFPNYLNSINIKKTNGSLNEYIINLRHQIAPGDNPNYIDNLISANGYNKIKITYGDANAGIEYNDVNALLVNAKSNFDFFNNAINYTLSATSSSVMSSVHRRNYPEVTARPSEIINKMLYQTGELLQYFPSMQSQTFVNSHNLIPSTDQKVTISAMSNVVPLNYLNTLVGSMTPNTGDGIYYLSILDEKDTGPYFKIEQINTSLTKSSFPLIYEVDINYPNENSLIYNFSVDSDYAWPLAYEYGGGFSNYNYDVDSKGNIFSSKTSAVTKSTGSTKMANTMDKNWWTNVTEFPVSATLEVKGLTSYVMLLNYIKVNVFYFGNKLRSSGIYIVTGQEDSLSENGFRTRLSLLRVAGDNQYINIDGRVVT